VGVTPLALHRIALGRRQCLISSPHVMERKTGEGRKSFPCFGREIDWA
jgi:hypothetical protein